MAVSITIEKVEELQDLLMAYATGTSPDADAYNSLRKLVLADPSVRTLVPKFVRDCRSYSQFWAFIKGHSTYAERRRYIWDEFAPLLQTLETSPRFPADEAISGSIDSLNTQEVSLIWSKALERRVTDSEGAITMARTLLESVCKHVLDELGSTYEEAWDLPKLYKTTAEILNLGPSQHTELVFKQILGGCSAVVGGLGSLRNKLSDAHGGGKSRARPQPRHAELAVNLAGAVATFIVETHKARKE